MQLIRETLASNPTALLYCIQYEILDKRPVFDSYRSFCRKMGPDVMDFVTFEFWYMRFYRDQMDMEYIRDTKPLELLDLPVELVDKVVKELDPVDRIITRQVCKTLQCIVDSQSCSIENVDFHISSNGISFGFDYDRVNYRKIGNGCKVKIDGSEFVVENENCVKTALKDFNFILNAQKRKLKKLRFTTHGMSPEDLDAWTSEFRNAEQIHVKNVHIGSSSDFDSIASIWTVFAPGILETVTFDCNISDSIPNAIVETEQWQQSKLVDLERCGLMLPRELSKFYGLRSFKVTVIRLEIKDIVQLRVNLRQSVRFKRCRIAGVPEFAIVELAAALGVDVQANGTIRDSIPDTSDYLEYSIHRWGLVIVKKHV